MGFLFFTPMYLSNELRANQELLSLRPLVAVPQTNNQTKEERFQNEVLRPILKWQNDLLLAYLIDLKNFDAVLKVKNQRSILEEKVKTFLQQNSVKWTLIGMTLGLLTQEELKDYQTMANAINKRILQMITRRVVDNL